MEILDAGGAKVLDGEIVTGPKTVTYKVNPLPAGTYQFRCVVHPHDDRHADGEIRSTHGDHRADARRDVPEWPVRVDDDDRPQEDRHPLPDQLVRLLLHRRHPGARRADPAGGPGQPALLAGPLQPALHDARVADALPVRHPDAGGLRQLRRAADDRRAGHGVPAHQRPVVLDAAAGRGHHAGRVPRPRRRRGGRLDELRAAHREDVLGARAPTSGSWPSCSSGRARSWAA